MQQMMVCLDVYVYRSQCVPRGFQDGKNMLADVDPYISHPQVEYVDSYSIELQQKKTVGF
jgi:hypothetical protein